MPRGRYSNTPVKTVDDLYEDYVRSLVTEKKNEHILMFLSKQSEGWGRLYPQTNVVMCAAVSEMEKFIKRPSQYQSDDCERSNIPDDNQPPQEYPNFSIASGMRQDLIQHSAINVIVAAIALLELSKPKNTDQLPFQPHQGVSGKQRLFDPFCNSPPITDNMKRADLTDGPSARSNDGSHTLGELSQRAARDLFVQELQCVVDEYEAELPTWSPDECADEYLRTFMILFTEKLKKFRETMKQSFAVISEMELSPILNISKLTTLYANVLNAGVDVEKVWLEFSDYRRENSNSNMVNINQHYYWCWQYFSDYGDIHKMYLNTLPEIFLS